MLLQGHLPLTLPELQSGAAKRPRDLHGSGQDVVILGLDITLEVLN